MNNLKYPKLFLAGLLLTLVLLVAALLCWFVSFLPPTNGCFWGVIALATPLVLFANCVALVVWLLWRKWWVALLPLLAILFNLGYILSNVQYTRSTDEKPDLRVASLNAGFYLLGDTSDGLNIVAREENMLFAIYERENFDILCLQEHYDWGLRTDPKIRRRVSQYFEEHYGFHVALGSDNAIVSRFPIVAFESEGVEVAGNNYLWADIVTPKDTVRVITTHLKSSGISQLRGQYRKEHGGEVPIRKMVSTLEQNNRMRRKQVGTIRQIIDSSPYPVLVTGDFNDTPSSYTYRKMKGDLHDSFREAGNGFGATFRGILGVLRIDYIFYDDAFRCTRFRTLDDPLSDHKLITADLCYE